MVYKSTKKEIKFRAAGEDLEEIAKVVKSRQRCLFTIGILTIFIALGIMALQRYQYLKNKAAQSEIFQSVYYFEKGDFDKALTGDGIYSSLLDIINKYSSTKIGNLAYLYAGICYMHKKKYDNAIKYLIKYKVNDFLLQARAYSLLGDAYVAKEDYITGAKYYIAAANYKPNEVFSPTYLTKAALAYEAKGDYKSAQHCYKEITERYKASMQYSDACKHISRLSAFLLQ